MKIKAENGYTIAKEKESKTKTGIMVSGEVNLATVVDSETYEKGQTIIYLGGSNFYLGHEKLLALNSTQIVGVIE